MAISVKDQVIKSLYLVSDRRLSQAIRVLIDRGYDEAVSLSARLSRLEDKERQGSVSFENASLERSQITEATLSIIGEKMGRINVEPAPQTLQTVEVERDYLQKVAQVRSYVLESLGDVFRFSKPDSELAENFKEFVKHSTEAEEGYLRDPLFDLDGRLYKHLMALASQIGSGARRMRKELNDKRLEEYVSLCKQEDPSWEQLSIVYAYAQSLGFKHTMVGQWIQSRPNDPQARKSVAALLAVYISTKN